MQIEKATSRELLKIKKIYLEAFPKSERKPFRLMKQKAAEGVMEFFAIREKGKLAGLAITVLYKDMVLLDYFAIEKSFRGQNLGTEALAFLKKRYEGRRFFLEIELPELEGPGRRKQFYLRNGMKETGVKVCLFQIPMELLTDGQNMVFEEYHEFYEQTIGPVFARKVERL